jgi:branched-chain amino acid transport system substrate-binding protein
MKRSSRSGLAFLATVSLFTLAACGIRVPRQEVIGALGARQASGSVAAGQAGDAGSFASGDTGAGTAGGAIGSAGGSSAAGGTSASGRAGAAAGPASKSGAANSTGGGARAANLSPVVIGNVGEYSGAVGASVGSGARMVQVVARWINAHGGLNGHPVKMLSADDGSDPSRYLTLAKDMVENQHAIAFIGNMMPLSAAGAEPYLRDKGVPVIGGDGAHSVWCSSPIMFLPGPCLKTTSIAGAAFAVSQQKPKLAVFYCAEAEPCHAFQEALNSPDAAKTGAQTVYTAQTSLAQPDFTSECLQAKNKGAQAIELGMDAASISRVARSCAQQGYHPLYLTTSVALTSTLNQDPNNEGVGATTPSFPWVANDLPGEREYNAAIQQYDPGLAVSTATSMDWLSGMVLMEAAKNLPANPTAQDILNGLWSIKGNDFGGLATPTTFTKGQPSPGWPCAFLIQNQGGKWVAPRGSKPLCLS